MADKSRSDRILRNCTRDMRIMEIGPSYNPIAAKAEGWNTYVVDHATQAELREKYRSQDVDRIEPVDAVWVRGPLHTAIPTDEYGNFDIVLGSHVAEHLVDLIGFFQSADILLKPSGTIILALPDLRVCFDFFQPHSTTGELLEAHAHQRTRHRKARVFDEHAYYVKYGDAIVWLHDDYTPRDFHLVHDLKLAFHLFNTTSEQPDADYTDCHAWTFTPKSFKLAMLELHALQQIPFVVTDIEEASGAEFYVTLARDETVPDAATVEVQRLELMKEILLEREEQIRRLQSLRLKPQHLPDLISRATPTIHNSPELTITAIIPLYNGAKYIVRAMNSVLNQTVKPIELFIVDDGSTDDGAEVVRNYIATTDLQGIDVKLFQKENGGQSSARNYGARFATGYYLAFLDQDDEWFRLHNETLLRPFIDPPPGPPLGLTYSNLAHADGNGMIIQSKMLSADQHPKVSRFNNISADMYVLPSASMFLREAFNEIGGFDERLSGYEDDDAVNRIFLRGYGNVFIDESLTKWCIHHSSSSYTYRMVKSRNIYCQKLLEMFPDDEKRSIYYARDLILPRFYPHAISEYQKALADGNDPERIADTHAALRYLLHCAELRGGMHNYMNPRKARRLRRLMDFVTPSRALTAYKLRRFVRPLARRVFL